MCGQLMPLAKGRACARNKADDCFAGLRQHYTRGMDSVITCPDNQTKPIARTQCASISPLQLLDKSYSSIASPSLQKGRVEGPFFGVRSVERTGMQDGICSFVGHSL